MAPRETENNAYAKFWGDKQRTLWYVMVFLEWSIQSSYSRGFIRNGIVTSDKKFTDLTNTNTILFNWCFLLV